MNAATGPLLETIFMVPSRAGERNASEIARAAARAYIASAKNELFSQYLAAAIGGGSDTGIQPSPAGPDGLRSAK